MGFVEKHAEVGEYHPEFLPPIAILELSQKVSRELVLKIREMVQQTVFYVQIVTS